MDIEGDQKRQKDKELQKEILKFMPNVSIAAILVVVGVLFFPKSNAILTAIAVFAAAIVAMPFMITRYMDYERKRQVEERFPLFLRDFVEAVRGGLTVPAAFSLVSKNEYGALNTHIRKISAQLEWGIPVDKVLMSFAKSTKSQLIARVVSSVIESHRYGGKLTETFEALSHTAVEVDRLREERKLFLNSQMMTGYIIFFVFLGVIISLETFLVPSIAGNTPIGLKSTGTDPKQLAAAFEDIFRNLILIQGFFAGLSVGKMSEGAMIAGLKHSLIMMAIGGGVYFMAGGIL